MTIQTNLLSLPQDIRHNIFTFVPKWQLQIGQLSKAAHAISEVEEMQPLASEYSNNPAIRPLIDRITFDRRPPTATQFVNKVYEEVIRNATAEVHKDRDIYGRTRAFPGTREILQQTLLEHRLIIHPSRLQEIVKWAERQKRAMDSAHLFRVIVELLKRAGLSAAARYLYEELDRQDLTLIEREREILSWMNNHAQDLETIQELNLFNLNFTNLPEEIGLLTGLEHFNLFGNQLTRLPAGFCKLTALKSLNLEGNKLIELPAEFCRLRALKELFLSKNQLTELPVGFGSLIKLDALNLDYNQLTELPVGFGCLKELAHLNLRNNKLRKLTEEFCGLKKLKWLFLENNQLVKLPAGFGNLIELDWVDLCDNQLTELPAGFERLSKLRVVFLDNNHLQERPKINAFTRISLDGNPLIQKKPKEPEEVNADDLI